LAPIIYVVKVLGHPEYKPENIASENLESAVRAYIAMREVPVDLVTSLSAYDCYSGTEYVVTHV